MAVTLVNGQGDQVLLRDRVTHGAVKMAREVHQHVPTLVTVGSGGIADHPGKPAVTVTAGTAATLADWLVASWDGFAAGQFTAVCSGE